MSLQVQLSTADAAAQTVDVLAVAVTEAGFEKQPLLVALNRALGGALFEQAKIADFKGKYEQQLDLLTLGKIAPRRLLLIGVGSVRDIDVARVRSACAVISRYASCQNARSLAVVPPHAADLRAVGEGLLMGAYRFSKYLTGDRVPKTQLGRVSVHVDRNASGAAEKRALELGRKIGGIVAIARDAVNEPPNELYPETLAELCKSTARKYNLSARVLDKKGIAAAGMKLHHAVGQGSINEPRFIHMTYRPAKKGKKKLAFVGKGLTFDSGGLCIKPAAGMGEMKSDMGGAAAVLALMAAVGVVRPEVEVHGIIGAAENMPDGAAYRPGDIFGSLSGMSVEIINTDAEGRLVLADALTYASRLEPDAIVDAATLTGAALVALGKTYSAFYATDDKLARRLEEAAKTAGEGFWRMPLIDELGEQLKSDVADLKHTGDRWGGSITAALFLQQFVGKVPWVHCDIAGPAFSDRAKGLYPKGGTGHAVLTFLHFVENFS